MTPSPPGRPGPQGQLQGNSIPDLAIGRQHERYKAIEKGLPYDTVCLGNTKTNKFSNLRYVTQHPMLAYNLQCPTLKVNLKVETQLAVRRS
jgi:hypothetical protein